MHFEPFFSKFESSFQRALIGNDVEVYGTNSALALAFIITQLRVTQYTQAQHLILVPTHQDAEMLLKNCFFFDPASLHFVHLLPSFDVHAYSGLYPNKKLTHQRLAWLFQAQLGQYGHFFISSMEALHQKTMPLELFKKHIRQYQPGDSFSAQDEAHLSFLGYDQVPLVEAPGQFAIKGGIVDIFSPSHPRPVRLDLFGDQIDSIKYFDPESQRSQEKLDAFHMTPAREVLYETGAQERLLKYAGSVSNNKDVLKTFFHQVQTQQFFHDAEFFITEFFKNPSIPIDYLSDHVNLWFFNREACLKSSDQWLSQLKLEFEGQQLSISPPPPVKLYSNLSNILERPYKKKIYFDPVQIIEDFDSENQNNLSFKTRQLQLRPNASSIDYLQSLRSQNSSVFIASKTKNSSLRVKALLSDHNFDVKIITQDSVKWGEWEREQQTKPNLIHIVNRSCSESLQLTHENISFMRAEDLLAKQSSDVTYHPQFDSNQIHALNFSDIKLNDPVVHRIHGIGLYQGLKILDVNGVKGEYIQLFYKDKDRLYLPAYNVSQLQKFSSPFQRSMLDKLGGSSWKKTQIKVRGHLKEVASELLKIYAERESSKREAFKPLDSMYFEFENKFPFIETPDQQKAIDDVHSDLEKDKPMDRLICGDVGFGKTEVAMRTAFRVASQGHQVAVLVPTTTLAFQHYESFKKRFHGWPLKIAALSRLTPSKEAKNIVQQLASGQIDIVIGTHKLFSKDIRFKRLALLIIDEEQKFGVTHKEKIRKLRSSVDTLVLSATPIPRTLNLSLLGLRDLSIITTPPVDRLPIRTFIFKYNEEIIKKAVLSEVARGGQVIFLHNRVRSIYRVEEELKKLLPQVRIRVAHGQMKVGELEDAILGFIQNKFDLLLCTSIIESGMDIPNANTILIDHAEAFGLSQLYQIRGRVGRSKQRAYCYLLIPNSGVDRQAQERLKVLQENTDLGSGLKVAHYDMELRGVGDILGEAQAGHIESVGHELYLELLQEAIQELKGEKPKQKPIEPDIHLKVVALIPDTYMPDIRLRLTYYRLISNCKEQSDLDQLEEDLRDRFGPVPEEVLNLMGLVLIKNLCVEMGIQGLNQGPKNLILTFDPSTRASQEKALSLNSQKSQKYKLVPPNKMTIQYHEEGWPHFYEELLKLRELIF